MRGRKESARLALSPPTAGITQQTMGFINFCGHREMNLYLPYARRFLNIPRSATLLRKKPTPKPSRV
ncbi:hypothetical protein SME06J_46800 [Serratia marcescens]|jgi:hypothetical protein|nr:hypothetical protein SME06J_46800 [Serratia marcescens]BEM55948.1 hypothetical protein SME20J_46350 [Serratia marcescens]